MKTNSFMVIGQLGIAAAIILGRYFDESWLTCFLTGFFTGLSLAGSFAYIIFNKKHLNRYNSFHVV